MQKAQLITWITNIIKTKIIKNDQTTLFELEAKIGKFKGLNYYSTKQLSQIKNMEQLDKTDLKYQFESKINQQQYENALDCLKQKQDQKLIQRVDFSLNKQQRTSFQLINSQFEAILIEKLKNTSQHIDIVQDQMNFRISLNQERTLSKSAKDIITQMPSRKQHANFIRLKETLFVTEENLEYALSKVLPLTRQDPLFSHVLDEISNAKHYEVKAKIEKIFKNNLLRDYEFEIEVAQNKNLTDEEINKLAISLLQNVEHFWNILQTKEKQTEEDDKQVEKKVKLNENE